MNDERNADRPPRAVAPDIAALRVTLVGYGEVGRIFGAALAAAGVASVTGYDILASDPPWMAAARARAAQDGVALASDVGPAAIRHRA